MADKYPFPTPENKALAERLKPGVLDERLTPPDWKGVGQCDGVFFLGQGVEIIQRKDGPVASPVDGEKEAFTFLRGMPPEWHLKIALQKRKEAGVSKPSGIEWLMPNDLRVESMKTERPIQWMFTQDPWCITVGSLPQQPQRVAVVEMPKWRVFRVSDVCWGVLYTP